MFGGRLAAMFRILNLAPAARTRRYLESTGQQYGQDSGAGEGGLARISKQNTRGRHFGFGRSGGGLDGGLLVNRHRCTCPPERRSPSKQKGFYSRPLRHDKVRLRRLRRCLNRQQLELRPRGGELG